MKSSKKRRTEIKSGRERKKTAAVKRVKRDALEHRLRYISNAVSAGAIPVDLDVLAPHGSRDEPEFVQTGLYFDLPFTCVDCGKDEVWTATQQKWWYEVAKGDRFTKALRCRACRRRERERKSEARRIHSEGLTKTKAGIR